MARPERFELQTLPDSGFHVLQFRPRAIRRSVATPAPEAGIAAHVWRSIEEIVGIFRQ
jgi:hypothetical protein